MIKIIRWSYDYSQDLAAARYQNHYPYELVHALAEAAGRLAAKGGSASLWEHFKVFDRRDSGDRLISDYLNAIATELVETGRAPDARFWSAWLPPANFILERVTQARR